MAATFEERFLSLLRELSEDTEAPVSNNEMKSWLNWKDETYDRTKAALVSKGMIVRAKGYGGSVRLVNPAKNSYQKKKPLTAFISYSHVDAEIKNELVKHLLPLKREGLLEGWHDGVIKVGERWADQISKNLASSHLIVLLISVDFINSEYCTGVELTRAMERDASGEAIVVPVIARSCLWHNEVFGQLQATPADGRSIRSFASMDDALTEVARAIRRKALDVLAGESNGT